MIGTFLRFLFLRVIGARGAMVLAALAFLLGRRRRDTPTPGYRRAPGRGSDRSRGPEDRTTAR